jgi:cephalosporin-C deacetylase-like acetyl esterase
MKSRNFVRDDTYGGLELTDFTGSFLNTAARVNKRVSHATEFNYNLLKHKTKRLKIMKKFSMTLLVLRVVFLVFLLILPPEINSSGAMSKKGNDSFLYQRRWNLAVQARRGNQVSTRSIVFDDFDLIEGLEIADLNQRRVIQLAGGSKKGRAESYFFDQPGKYDITLFYVDESSAKSSVKIIINDRGIGNITFGSSDSNKEKTIPGINIQQWSKIALEFIGNGNEKCRVERLVFTPIGAFDGKEEKLAKAMTLGIFETTSDRLIARRMFSSYVRVHRDSLEKIRNSELSGLRSPAEWKARQEKTRDQLAKFFGEFPERTPLNARIVDKLDREHYTIEKVIFESQPKYYVTANLYVPKGRELPLPGVIFTCGHSDEAKAYDEYQMTCSGLALKGYVVLIFDPMGQGERVEYFDPETKKSFAEWGAYFGVSQHHYVLRPAFLVDWTLSGLRIWDAIRAVDYLVSRPEVDKNKIASVGQSGGGQMALLITAVDERIKVCAASHPGGSCEETYLNGRDFPNREILSLIPPRPLRIVVGKESGEEPRHRRTIEDLQSIYEVLGAGRQCADLDVVPGIHSMNRSNRESVYEWLNKWFDKEAEGKAEAKIEPEKIETLWCTKSGNTIVSLGGETGQTLNAKRAGQIYKSEIDLMKLKERVATRIGLALPRDGQVPQVNSFETFTHEDLTIEKLTYQSEKGIIIPALLMKPKNVKSGSPIYIYASDKGKPSRFDNSVLPFSLAKNGFIVLAIDVRGTGETSQTPQLSLNQYTGYNPLQWQHDALAIESGSFGRTTLGMRTFDMLRGIDFITSRKDLEGRKIVTIGEGSGGLWALLASVYDARIEGVVTVGTLPSYMQLITNQYYNVWGYFWAPGALRDFDIPDLARLVSPKPQVWIDPVNNLGEKLGSSSASSIIGSYKNLQIITTDKKSAKGTIELFNTTFK